MIPVWIVSTAGVSTSTTSTSPPSSSRWTVAVPFPSSSLVTTATRGQVEQLGERRARRRLDGVARLHAGEDEVGALAPHDVRQRPRDGDRVGAGELVRPDPHAAVGAHGERAAHRVLGVLVSDGDRDDLTVAGRVAELERLLRRVRVPLVERVVEVVGIDVPLVVGELDFVPERPYLLDADDDLQTASASRSTTRRSRLNGSGVSGSSVSISRARRCPEKIASAVSRGASQSPIR